MKESTMLRITTHSTADALMFQLEGKLVGPWVAELQDCWRNAPGPDKRPVQIDLRAVTYVDGAGRLLLADLYRQGAQFRALDCQMKAIVAEIEETSGKPFSEGENDHATGDAKPKRQA
jgi:ABC-type transporter Mla MlaB component